MNDKLIMENYLLLLKSDVEVFVHGTLESSNLKTRKLLKTVLFDILSSQARCYDEMTKYGWYTVNNINKSTIGKSLQKIKNQS